MRGKITENVTFVTKPAMIECKIENTSKSLLGVSECFPVLGDTPSPGSLNWAKTGDVSEYDIPKFTVKNGPFKNVQIVGYDIRQQTGATYKAVVENQFLVDLRCDVLMDLISNSSIVNGIISADMIFASVGSGSKLIRIGSDVYNEIIGFQEATPVNKKELKPENIYSFGGKTFTFIAENFEYYDTIYGQFSTERMYKKTTLKQFWVGQLTSPKWVESHHGAFLYPYVYDNEPPRSSKKIVHISKLDLSNFSETIYDLLLTAPSDKFDSSYIFNILNLCNIAKIYKPEIVDVPAYIIIKNLVESRLAK